MMHLAVNILDLMVLWGSLALGAACVWAALAAGRVEKEQGLPRSRSRPIAALVVCAIVAAGAVVGSYLIMRTSGGGGAGAPPLTNSPAIAPAQRQRLQARLEELETLREDRLAELSKGDLEIMRINDELTKVRQQLGAKAQAPTTPRRFAFDLRALLRFLVPLAALACLALLFILGDPAALPRLLRLAVRKEQVGERSRQSLGSLDLLTSAAHEGRFLDGLTHAAAVDANLLDRFDRLDWLFLKSYCAVQQASGNQEADTRRRELAQGAIRDLTAMLEEAPERGEAVYLLADAHGLVGAYEPALEAFTKAKPMLPEKLGLPFDHNQSVCLMQLAEQLMGRGDTQGAGRLFDRVTQLKALVEQVPMILIKMRLLDVRQQLQEGKLQEAEAGLNVLHDLKGLGATERGYVDVVCDAVRVLIAIRGGSDERMLREVDGFLARHLPPKLPEPDEGIVDEYLDTPLSGMEVKIAPQVFRAMFVLKAAIAARAAAKAGVALNPDEVGPIAGPLLRALQFELRQRDALAAIGGLYYWFIPEKRAKALQWLESAVDMGVESVIARRLLERARHVEKENRHILEWFRSTAAAFLHDPTVAAQVRAALIEELGRFQAFEPLLIDLRTAPPMEPREPTIRLLRERAACLDQMATDVAERRSDVNNAELRQLRMDYRRVIESLDASADRISEIERRLIQEIGKTVLS